MNFRNSTADRAERKLGFPLRTDRFVAESQDTAMEGLMEPSDRLVGAMFFAIGAAIAAPAFGQEAGKHAVTSTYKVLVDNARVIAGEATWAPGTQDANVARSARVIRGLVGGTLSVIYADGRTEKRTFEPGGVYYFEQDTVANYLRNDGTSEVKVYFVILK